MASQKKNIIEEIVGKTEVLTSKVTEVSGKNSYNLMDTATED